MYSNEESPWQKAEPSLSPRFLLLSDPLNFFERINLSVFDRSLFSMGVTTLRDTFTVALRGLWTKYDFDGMLFKAKETCLEQIAIDIDRLSVQVGGQRVFSNFSLRLAKGHKASLVGPSGSGKSTLLLALLGFVAPTEGTIRIFEEELTASSVWQLRTRMAYVPQEPELGEGTVRQILNHPLTFKNNRHLQGNIERAPELMEKLYLPRYLLDKDVTSLSGGEKQRVALISALLLEREILLLDEASSALDQSARQAAIDLLKSRKDLTLLSVTHDREWIEAADDLIELSGVQRTPKGAGA